jgi:DNA-binding transcriptional regulator YiaG
MKKLKITPYYGMDYITVEIPVKPSKHGDILALPAGEVEKLVARAILENRIPIRGIELKFLRKAIKLSQGGFAAEIGLTGPCILKWERAEKVRLAPINEVAVRALVADKLGMPIDGRFSNLLGRDDTIQPLHVVASR